MSSLIDLRVGDEFYPCPIGITVKEALELLRDNYSCSGGRIHHNNAPMYPLSSIITGDGDYEFLGFRTGTCPVKKILTSLYVIFIITIISLSLVSYIYIIVELTATNLERRLEERFQSNDERFQRLEAIAASVTGSPQSTSVQTAGSVRTISSDDRTSITSVADINRLSGQGSSTTDFDWIEKSDEK